ncbi:MAG: hypothetical protein LBS50_11270 [Prevotellaceae bacterium]|jgi:hypothetical protein|nr:hypothetical protein [Prevotellaceae bacterium]
MKIKLLDIEKKSESRNDKSLGIQTYGESNDYPQQVMNLLAASCTGGSCYSNYRKFVTGKGFADLNIYGKKINRQNHTLDYLLEQITNDLAMFGGFAMHVNYNANFKVSEVQYIPFEQVRFEKLNENGEFNRVALHPDWARQFTALRKWKKDDICFINFFNPDPEIIAMQVENAGGWAKYKGQVFYFSNEGDKCYPLPIFNDVLTDMNTEEAISNLTNRNATKNFFPAGMLINKRQRAESEEQESETERSLLEFQSSKNACKIFYVEVESDEEIPEFVPFRATNYDKEFSVSRDSAKDNIGRSFNQPPILRSENIGGNFGADLMKNAYNYYNSVTENERIILERNLTAIFTHWWQPFEMNFKITPLSYNYSEE